MRAIRTQVSGGLAAPGGRSRARRDELPSGKAAADRAAWSRRVGLALLAGLTLALAACGGREAREDRPPALPGPTAVERREIHDGLERIGRLCSAKERPPGVERVTAQQVQRLLALGRRYPTQRFALDRGGETGTMLSVLLVARAEIVGCAPGAAEAIDRVLPATVRRALPPAGSEPGR